MTEHRVLHQGDLAGEGAVFPPLSRANFAASYPEGPHKLRHNLSAHPLLELDALAELGEALPARSVEYNRGDVPIGVESQAGVATPGRRESHSLGGPRASRRVSG